MPNQIDFTSLFAERELSPEVFNETVETKQKREYVPDPQLLTPALWKQAQDTMKDNIYINCMIIPRMNNIVGNFNHNYNKNAKDANGKFIQGVKENIIYDTHAYNLYPIISTFKPNLPEGVPGVYNKPDLRAYSKDIYNYTWANIQYLSNMYRKDESNPEHLRKKYEAINNAFGSPKLRYMANIAVVESNCEQFKHKMFTIDMTSYGAKHCITALKIIDPNDPNKFTPRTHGITSPKMPLTRIMFGLQEGASGGFPSFKFSLLPDQNTDYSNFFMQLCNKIANENTANAVDGVVLPTIPDLDRFHYKNDTHISEELRNDINALYEAEEYKAKEYIFKYLPELITFKVKGKHTYINDITASDFISEKAVESNINNVQPAANVVLNQQQIDAFNQPAGMNISFDQPTQATSVEGIFGGDFDFGDQSFNPKPFTIDDSAGLLAGFNVEGDGQMPF